MNNNMYADTRVNVGCMREGTCEGEAATCGNVVSATTESEGESWSHREGFRVSVCAYARRGLPAMETRLRDGDSVHIAVHTSGLHRGVTLT